MDFCPDSFYSNDRLRLWNRLASSLHFVQFITILALASRVDRFKDFQLPVTYSYYTLGLEGLQPATGSFGMAAIAPFICLFFLLSAVSQLLTTVGACNRIYVADLDRGVNRFRWYEYSLTGSIMLCVVASLVGITDLCSLINIFVLNTCMNLFGLYMEFDNIGAEKSGISWYPFLYYCIAAFAPKVSIFTSLVQSQSVPSFVYAVFVTYLIMSSLSAFNALLSFVKCGPWKEYRFSEFVYILLSVVAKSMMGWLVFGGLNQRNSFKL